MKKNTKSVKSKNKTIKINKNKVTAAVETAPVTETVAQNIPVVDNTPIPVINIPANNQVKRGRGRPQNSTSLSMVSLKSLVEALPSDASFPLSNTVIRSLANIGIKLPSSPFKASPGALSEITKKYKQNSVAAVIDLNKSEVTV